VTHDELRGHIAAVLALPLSGNQTTAALLSHVNGAEPKQLLTAALAVAREEYGHKIQELELALTESEREPALRDGLKNLLAEGG
jgi:hypothetical protein